MTIQDFTFNTFITLSGTILEQVAPAPAGSVQTNIMSYSGSGDVTAAVTALAPPVAGCPLFGRVASNCPA